MTKQLPDPFSYNLSNPWLGLIRCNNHIRLILHGELSSSCHPLFDAHTLSKFFETTLHTDQLHNITPLHQHKPHINIRMHEKAELHFFSIFLCKKTLHGAPKNRSRVQWMTISSISIAKRSSHALIPMKCLPLCFCHDYFHKCLCITTLKSPTSVQSFLSPDMKSCV